jgi:hypothetical protein
MNEVIAITNLSSSEQVKSAEQSDLEINIKIQEGYELLMAQIEKLKVSLSEQTHRVERLTHCGKTYTATEIAKELNLKSAIELNRLLETMEVHYQRNGTWVLHSRYSGKGYEALKQEELKNGCIVYYRHWTGKGRDFLLGLLTKPEQQRIGA